ncbi:MAG: N-acetylglucosamine kinase [Beutenbergiaceae bacterium]
MITFSHAVAVDAGGTSTRAMVIDAQAQCLGIGRSGRGNPISDGADAAAASISEAVAAALIAANLPGTSVQAFSVAMAGGNTMTGHAQWLHEPLARLGISADVAVEPDLLAMFCSGTPELDGYALISGTGAIAALIRNGRIDRFSDGIGWLLGDTGSGFWIGREVVRAVALALDGREPKTSMVSAVLRHYGIELNNAVVNGHVVSLNDLVRLTYDRSPLSLAALAPIAFEDPDDPVSLSILVRAAHALATSVTAVHQPELRGPLVIGGGVLSHQPRLHRATLDELATQGIDCPVIDVSDGLIGAGMLVLRRGGLTVDDAAFQRLRRSTATQLSLSKRGYRG